MAKKNTTKTKGEKKMSMTPNFVINPGDARLLRGTNRKAKDAVPAQAAVKEAKDKDGNVTTKGRPAVPAKPAVKQSYRMVIGCNTEEIAKELVARMADQGFAEENDGQVIKEKDGQFTTVYVAETDKIIRAAFKKAKSKDGYNAPGLKVIADKKKADAKAKREAENAKKPKPVEKKKAPAKKKKEAKDEDAWPEA